MPSKPISTLNDVELTNFVEARRAARALIVYEKKSKRKVDPTSLEGVARSLGTTVQNIVGPLSEILKEGDSK